ncbi:MAG TPA: heavy metal translocating P-type ATPase, partial [Devosia sp.]|nr:heavy metal translocating P-type ATPase [Devosia sp.]
MSRLFPYALVVVALLGLAVGVALWWWGQSAQATTAWALATLPVLASLLVQIALSLRRGDVGLDVVAALSMTAALVFGEPLAGNVVALMYAGGQLLESFAQGRAQHEMTALLGRVARTAMRFQGAGLAEVPITAITPGDRLLIREGEVLPVDGKVANAVALLDLSALTGESVPQRVAIGEEALSGATSTGSPFELIATRAAAESTYAGIVRLVQAAQKTKAPMVRLADRYAIGFLALTLLIAGAAWIATQDPIRALAVLVVATPCPLILAVPVAIISGMSRTARAGVLIKNGGVLEALAQVRTAVIDKTGTLTHGQAAISEIRTSGAFSEAEVLYFAASLDQASGHVVAATLVEAANQRGLSLSAPVEVDETPGLGIEGRVDGRRVVAGGDDFVQRLTRGVDPHDLHSGLGSDTMTVAVAVDGALAGVIVLQDRVHADARGTLAALRQAGVERIVLASGDKHAIALAVGEQLGVDLILGDLTPEDKVQAV